VVEVVGEDVHGQGRHADVHLVTNMALLGIVRVQSPVCLPVPGEVAAGGVVLTALRTGVLRLGLLHQSLLLLGAAVTCKKGLVSVGSRAAVVDLEHGGLLSPVTWLGFSLHI